MTILLTGGAGYIGSHTAVELLEAGHEVVLADDFENSSGEVLGRIEAITGREVCCHEVDVRQASALAEVFEQHRFDAVIHFAGLKAVGESVRQPLRYYRHNIEAALTVLDVMERFGVRRFVFSSSATVYGDPDEVPLTEQAPVWRCSNPYGWTKQMIEQILCDWAAANPEASVVLLRYFNPIGAHASGLIGEDPAGIPNNLMPYVSQVAIGKLPQLRVFGSDWNTPDGTCQRDYIHVVDLALGHLRAVEYAMDRQGTEVFNLGTGVPVSVLELVHTFEQVNQVPVPYVLAERRAGDVAAYWADPGKAQRVLGWRAERDLAAMCRDAWNWQRKNPNGYRGA